MIELAPFYGNVLPYNESWLYCLTLSYDNHKDWRLPTYHEAGVQFYKLIPHTAWYDSDYPTTEGITRTTQPVRTK